VLIGGLIGIVLGYCAIGSQWHARLEAMGVNSAGPGQSGYVENIQYYRLSKFKTFHDDAQIGGDLRIKWDNK
jgi:hypothetical protein